MRGTYITAGAIALAIALWLVSGVIGGGGPLRHSSLAEANREQAAESQDDTLPRVRARVIQAAPQIREVVLRGRTENKRTVAVKAETSGRVVERPVERGTEVKQGDLLCRISMEDRKAALDEARAALEQARIEHQASLRLKEKGFQSETAIAQANARLAAAQAQVASRELDIEHTYVRAPFDGVVEDVSLEIGDYVSPGGTCVTVVDLDPMLLVGQVSERNVSELQPGQTVTGELADGRTVRGPITFIGRQADPATRTYPVEARIANADHAVRSGITTEMHIPVQQVLAQKVSPSLFILDDDGHIGVRTVNDQHRVEYHRVDIVREDSDGVWVTGLPRVTTLITVGQELVVPGQEVELSFEPRSEMPAKADDAGHPAASETEGAADGAVGAGEAAMVVAAQS